MNLNRGNVTKNPTSSPTKENEKKRIKKKLLWNSAYTIKNVSCPVALDSKSIKKRYKLNLEYADNNNKLRKKTIRFGKNGVQEFIDDQNDEKKNRLLSKLGNTHNPLHANFWRFHLLNGDSTDLKKNWMEIINKI